MAANFESGLTFGEKSWHAEEKNLPANHPLRYDLRGCMVEGDMDWTVDKFQMAPLAGRAKGTPAPGCYGVYRTDRWEFLGAVGESYECLQNVDLFDQFQPFMDCKALAVESVGALEGGRRVYVQCKLDVDDMDIGGGDLVRAYMLLASSHNMSLATNIGFTPQRVVCDNTLAMAIRNRQSRLMRVRHTSGQKPALKEIMKSVDLARQEFVANIEQYRRLKRLPINERDLAKYVRVVLNIDPEAGWDDVSNQAKVKYNRIIELALGGLGNAADELTAWTAYNGVTQWLTHERGKDTGKRLASLWFGDSAAANRRALDAAFALAG